MSLDLAQMMAPPGRPVRKADERQLILIQAARALEDCATSARKSAHRVAATSGMISFGGRRRRAQISLLLVGEDVLDLQPAVLAGSIVGELVLVEEADEVLARDVE